jgi:hypothetical protein
MAIHVCRDFLSWGNPITNFGPWYTKYLVACFLRGTLGYTVIGQTGFNLDGGTFRLGNGFNGSLNQGGTDLYAFAPNGYSVSAADIGRILALRSTNNTMVNSGLFRITGVNTTNNWLYVNYRSGDVPPVETGMTWTVYENEFVFYNATQNGGNGIVGTYQTQGVGSNATRIVLQSPSTLNWQVRLALESNYDNVFGGGGSVTPINGGGAAGTTAPGYGGNSLGDFQPGGQHLHTALFYNIHSTQWTGGTVDIWPSSPNSSANQGRLYIWGDDRTGSCFAALRNVVGGGTDSFVHFGLCEDEEQPLPPHNVQRLFVMGANGIGNGGSNGIYWACGRNAARNGMGFGLSNQPISAVYSLYNPLAGETFQPSNTAARNSVNAGDNQYIASTELLPVDIIVGTEDNVNSWFDSAEHFILEGRRLGRAPMVRMGRSNYGYFQISTDPNRSWLHLNDGIYLPWQGSILP